MRRALIGVTVAFASVVPAAVSAHDGPPYPIASDRVAGPYRISIWTDPDTTDDGSLGGQFWVKLDAAQSTTLPPRTQATVTIRPLDRPGPERRAAATPVGGDIKNQFAAVLMDHEGRFAVRVGVNGPAGGVTLDSQVDATYDLRPPPYLLVVYVIPFLLAGLLWGRVIVKRRSASRHSMERTVSPRALLQRYRAICVLYCSTSTTPIRSRAASIPSRRCGCSTRPSSRR